MDQQRSFYHLAGQQGGHGLERAVYTFVDGGALFGQGLLQHPVDDFRFDTRVPDAQPQAPVVGGA